MALDDHVTLSVSDRWETDQSQVERGEGGDLWLGAARGREMWEGVKACLFLFGALREDYLKSRL